MTGASLVFGSFFTENYRDLNENLVSLVSSITTQPKQ